MAKRVSKKGFVRMTITVSADMRKKMSKYDASVNWSAIACDAFESTIVKLGQKTKLGANMEKLINSMRDMDREDQSEDYKRGFEFGEGAVSMGQMRPKQLRNLEALLNGQDANMFFDGWVDSAFGNHGVLFFTMSPEHAGERKESDDFWETVAGRNKQEAHDNMQSLEFLHGFCDGALSFWNEIKDQI